MIDTEKRYKGALMTIASFDDEDDICFAKKVAINSLEPRGNIWIYDRSVMAFALGALVTSALYLVIFAYTAKQTPICENSFVGFRIEQCLGRL